MIFLLQGCSVLDFIKPNPGLSVETELVVGDKQEEIATGAVVGKKQTTNTSNTAETITQTYHTVNKGKTISDIMLYILLAFLLGVTMPSWRQMWLMTQRKLRKQ
jgi:hypothetical protein